MIRTPQSSQKAGRLDSAAKRTLAYKHDMEERQSLEKSNFELKMKVFHLEDALKRITEGESNDLKAELEGKNVEIEQKNVLILKAKAAIQALKDENQRLSTEDSGNGEYQRMLEEKVQAMLENEKTITLEFKRQFSMVESQFKDLKSAHAEKDEALRLAESDIKRLEETNSVLVRAKEDLEKAKTFSENEKDAMMNESVKMREDELNMQEQLMQAQAHIELYKKQLHELSQELEVATREIASLSESKMDQSTVITGLQERLKDTEQTIVAMSEEHSRQVAQLKVEYAHNWTVNDQLSRQKERDEFNSIKDEWIERISEKNSALVSLQYDNKDARVGFSCSPFILICYLRRKSPALSMTP